MEPEAIRESVNRLLSLPADPHLISNWTMDSSVDAADSVDATEESGFPRLYQQLLVLCRMDPTLALEAVEHLRRSGSSGTDLAAMERLAGHALRVVGRVRDSIPRYARSASLYRRRGEHDEEAKTIIGWTFALATCGRSKEARTIAARGRKLIGPRDILSLARLETNLASAWHMVGQFDNALPAYRSALRAFERAEAWPQAGVVGQHLSLLYLWTGDLKKARVFGERALQHFSDLPSGTVEPLYVRTVLAALDLAEGRWEDGTKAIQNLREEFTALGDARAEAWLSRELAILFASLGAIEAALPEAESAVRRFRELGLPIDEAHACFHYGRLLAASGDSQEALSYFHRARQHWQETRNTRRLHRTAIETARLLFRAEQTDRALKLVRESQRYLDRRDPAGDGALARALSAEIALHQGRIRTARRLAKKAHSLARRYPASLERPSMSLVLARAWAASGNRPAAIRWAKRSVRELESLLLRFGSRQLRILVGESRDRIYGGAIDLILSLGGRAAEGTAVDLLSQARSPNLMEDLIQDRLDHLQPSTRVAILRLRDQILSPEGSEETDDLRSRSFSAEITRLDRRLGSGPTRPPAIVHRAMKNRSFQRWRQQLHGREVVLYDRGESWRVFLIRSTGRVECIALPDAEIALRDAWFSLRMTFETASRAPQKRRVELLQRTLTESLKDLEQLRAALWDPIPLRSSQVVVVPFRELHSLPLESLELSNERTVSRLPHPSLLSTRRGRRTRRALLLHGPEEGMRREVATVARLLRREQYSVSVSNTRKRLDREEDQLGVLHVAAHGTFQRSGWLTAGLQLADGWLGFEHLRRKQLQNALVQFTSCESGMVEVMPGSDIEGWTSTALAAGARELVLTVWKIDSDSAHTFSTAFSSRWARGETAAEAARAARHELRSKSPHPYHWAPFVVVARD